MLVSRSSLSRNPAAVAERNWLIAVSYQLLAKTDAPDFILDLAFSAFTIRFETWVALTWRDGLDAWKRFGGIVDGWH